MTSRTITGARPVDGSSSSRIDGPCHQRHAQRQDLLLAAGQRAGDLRAALARIGNRR